jgi:hypothetical protein
MSFGRNSCRLDTAASGCFGGFPSLGDLMSFGATITVVGGFPGFACEAVAAGSAVEDGGMVGRACASAPATFSDAGAC